MKILAIDYGSKRVGLALSDETKTFARPLQVIALEQFWKDITDLITEHTIEEIIVGLPLNLSGQDSQKTTEVRQFIEQLKTTVTVPVNFFDERFSSALAESTYGKNKIIDDVAAQIILQNYLDFKHHV